jgi:hypothetical protein
MAEKVTKSARKVSVATKEARESTQRVADVGEASTSAMSGLMSQIGATGGGFRSLVGIGTLLAAVIGKEVIGALRGMSSRLRETEKPAEASSAGMWSVHQAITAMSKAGAPGQEMIKNLVFQMSVLGTSLSTTQTYLLAFGAVVATVLGGTMVYAAANLATFINKVHVSANALAQTGVGLWFLSQTAPALQAALALDTYETSFSGMLQSMEKGKQMNDFIRSYGMKSPFEQTPIRAAVRTLTAGGLDVNRYLPIMETFALFRGPQSENLEDMAAIFRRLLGGQIADSLGPEGMGRFGINRSMFTKMGAKFTPAGSFIGTVQQALDMLERVATELPVMKALRKYFETSYIVKYSNAMDSIHFAMERAGIGILKHFAPALDAIANTVRGMAESGMIEDLFRQLSVFFGGDKSGMGARFESSLVTLYTIIEFMPTVLETAWEFLTGFVRAMLTLVDIAIRAVLHAIPVVGPSLAMSMPKLTDGLGVGQMGAEFGNAFNAMREYNLLRFRTAKPGGATAPSTDGDQTDTYAGSMLGSIAKNTAKTNQILEDYKQQVFGGGNRAAMGIDQVNMGRVRRSTRTTQRVAIMLDQAVNEQATEMFENYIRNQRGGR